MPLPSSFNLVQVTTTPIKEILTEFRISFGHIDRRNASIYPTTHCQCNISPASDSRYLVPLPAALDCRRQAGPHSGVTRSTDPCPPLSLLIGFANSLRSVVQLASAPNPRPRRITNVVTLRLVPRKLTDIVRDSAHWISHTSVH